MPRKRSWTIEQLTAAVKNNYSMRATIQELGLIPTGGNYKSIKSYIKSLVLDNSHWTGQGHLKGKSHWWGKRTPDDEIFCRDSTYLGTGNAIKKRLVENHGFNYCCSATDCELSTWRGKSLALHLDHINGVRDDNRVDNLRLLCPNCHSQTPTYAGKNKKKHRKMLHA